MVQVRINYKNSYTELFCPMCKDPTKQDNQQHLLLCKKLMENENLVIKTRIEYTDIFSKQVEKQCAVTLIFDQVLEKRKRLEKLTNKD